VEVEDFLMDEVLVRRVVGLLLEDKADEVEVLRWTELLEERRTEVDVLRLLDVLGFTDDEELEEPEFKRAPQTPELYEGVKMLPFI